MAAGGDAGQFLGIGDTVTGILCRRLSVALGEYKQFHLSIAILAERSCSCACACACMLLRMHFLS